MKEKDGHNRQGKEPGNFGLPEGYFRRSALSIANRIAWEEEHRAFPELKARRTQPFCVPGGYFAGNEQRLELTMYPVLATLQKETGFTVPENYFEEQELARVLNTEQPEVAFLKTVAGLSKETGFGTPGNYFAASERQLKQQLMPPAGGRVISLFVKRSGYAAAAIVLALLGTWLYGIYTKPAAAQDCGTIACLDRKDLVKTKQLESLDDEQLFDLVDPAALEQKLETPATSQPKINKEDSSLKDLTTEELLDDI